MSAKAGTIEAPKMHGGAWIYWMMALVVASVVAAFTIWAVVGRETAPAVNTGPKVTVVGPTREAPKGPPQFREGPNGEAYPAPRVAP
jgi:hypothetical protein